MSSKRVEQNEIKICQDQKKAATSLGVEQFHLHLGTAWPWKTEGGGSCFQRVDHALLLTTANGSTFHHVNGLVEDKYASPLINILPF